MAFTVGPGLMGSLLVGTLFAKGFALGLNIPLIEVNHLQAHILALFIKENSPEFLDKKYKVPSFPFLCLTVSGGHTQIAIVHSYYNYEIIGRTIDDAAGECFDKSAKILGLPYPGGPVIDEYAKKGNNKAFPFPEPQISALDFSFSGLKTSVLYFVEKQVKKEPRFIEENLNDLCASIQATIVKILLNKLKKAAEQTGIKEIAIAGGVSANSGLRNTLLQTKKTLDWNVFIPKIKYTTDNAAMVAITGYYKYLRKDFSKHDVVPFAKGN